MPSARCLERASCAVRFCATSESCATVPGRGPLQSMGTAAVTVSGCVNGARAALHRPVRTQRPSSRSTFRRRFLAAPDDLGRVDAYRYDLPDERIAKYPLSL